MIDAIPAYKMWGLRKCAEPHCPRQVYLRNVTFEGEPPRIIRDHGVVKLLTNPDKPRKGRGVR